MHEEDFYQIFAIIVYSSISVEFYLRVFIDLNCLYTFVSYELCDCDISSRSQVWYPNSAKYELNGFCQFLSCFKDSIRFLFKNTAWKQCTYKHFVTLSHGIYRRPFCISSV